MEESSKSSSESFTISWWNSGWPMCQVLVWEQWLLLIIQTQKHAGAVAGEVGAGIGGALLGAVGAPLMAHLFIHNGFDSQSDQSDADN